MVEPYDTTEFIEDAPKPRVLKERYEVLGLIGKGGMAEVFKGRDEVLNRDVAIKIMKSQYASDSSFAERFRTEAQAAAQLSSPYAVPVYDYGEEDGQQFIVMDLVQGENLKSVLNKTGAIPPKSVAHIAWQVCSALKKAHSMGIIHRDIKSSNIMMTRGDRGPNAKIMDFGIAQAAHLSSKSSDEGLILGTAHYMSPEQASGGAVTAATDIYSLGIVMYEAAVGRVPFVGVGVERLIWKQVNEKPVPPQHLEPAVDDELNDIILRALEKNPQDRFASASEMLAVLDAYEASAKHPHRDIGYPQFWAIGFLKAPPDMIGSVKRVDKPCYIGRSDESDIMIREGSVSREHLKLIPRGMYLEAENLSLTNGTLLNGKPLDEPTLCSAGDTLDIGNVQVRIGKSAGSL
ncbi:MAG: protein kinase [Eggerthellaceae bacterium]|nr:protein kinase [Eggerthellaceae bacterium]